MKNLFSFILLLVGTSVFSQVPKIELITFSQGLVKPLDIKHCGDSRLFVVEQAGRIRIIQSTGSLVTTPFMNIAYKVNSASNEQGLLAMAFSPKYKTDGYFFVCYIKGSGTGNSILAIQRKPA